MLTSRRPKELCFVSVQIAQLLDEFRIASARCLGEFVNGVEFRLVQMVGIALGGRIYRGLRGLVAFDGLRERGCNAGLRFGFPPPSQRAAFA